MHVSNLQVNIAIGLPIVAVLTSLTISLVQISGIREEIRDIRGEFREMRREAREDRLGIDADIKLLTGKVYDLVPGKQ